MYKDNKGDFMKRIELGNTGEKVSSFCLGCMLFGATVDKDTSYKLLDKYVEYGGNFLDTSNNYAFWIEGCKGGESETLLGEWMKERGNRKDIFLATKVGANPVDREKVNEDFLGAVEGLSREAIINGVNGSLKRLQTDYIDLLYIHIDYRAVPLEETLGALNELIREGKVKHIGCSNLKSWRVQEAKDICRRNSWVEFSAIQQSYTYLNPRQGSDFWVNEYVDDSLLDYIDHYKDITLMAYSPLMSGYYTRPERRETYWRKEFYENAGNEKKLEALTTIAKKYNTNENQIVLAWMLQKDIPAIPLIAASKLEQLIENMESENVVLNKEDLEHLELS